MTSAEPPCNDDQADIAASLRGDGLAFARLIRRYQDQVAADLSRFTRDRLRLDELTQDVFVEAYCSLRTFRGKAPFGHWLRKITVRVGYRYLRQVAREHARHPVEMGDFSAPAFPSGASAAQAALRQAQGSGEHGRTAADRVHALLERLPPRDRLVLTLKYLDGLSAAEIAERTGWSRIMVKVQAFRARRKLKRILESDEEGET